MILYSILYLSWKYFVYNYKYTENSLVQNIKYTTYTCMYNENKLLDNEMNENHSRK